MAIKIIITDDHPMVVNGLEHVLSSDPEMKIIGTFYQGSLLLQALENLQPDVLLLDLQIPDISGKEIVTEIVQKYPLVRIIILTSHEATHYVEEMLQLGCAGYLLKSFTDHVRLLQAVKTVAGGNLFIDESIQKQLLQNVLKERKKQENAIELLTRREKEVLQLIAQEQTNQEIATTLFVSVRTIECHRLSLLHKLRVKNTAGLVKKAMELRLIK